MKASKYLIGFFLGLNLAIAAIWAQSSDPVSEAPPPVSLPEEREKLLQRLKAEIEPNLPEADVKKINQNVMELGSYRQEWVETARKFLVANAPLAELYLYKYSLVKNPRLNHAILETLVLFEAYRFPKAALLFAEVLGTSARGRDRLMTLFERVSAQDPQVGVEISRWLDSDRGQEFSVEQKLRFGTKLCHKLQGRIDEGTRGLLQQWLSQGRSVWSSIVSAELRSCLTGV